MASAASLVVRISADLNDFSKKLDKMTKDVDKAAKRVGDVSKALTLAITVPVAAATVALGKMAAENEDVAGRMSRVFGTMADSVEGSITQMMKSVPEGRTELEKMAIAVDNMLQGMELGPDKAAAMSKSLMQLAGDAAAFAHVPMADALDALERGLAGKTKGLMEFGIAISQADIKQRAMQMGILKSGNELTEAGTALASYSLIMEKSSRITGEAARTAEQSGKSFAFLKRDLGELGDNASHLVLPALSSLAKNADAVVLALDGMSDTTKKTIMDLAAVAAIVGPTIYGIAKLAQGYIAVKSAITLLTTGTSVAAFFAGLTNPIGLVIAGVVALSAALAGLYMVWKKFQGGSSNPASALANDPVLAAALGAGKGGVGTGGVVTQRDPKDAMAQMKDAAAQVASAFDAAIQHGTGTVAIYERIVALQKESAAMLASNGPFTKEGQAAQEVADQVQRIKDAIDLMNAGPGEARSILNGIGARPFNVGAAGALSAVDSANNYRKDLATRSAASFYGTPYDAHAEAGIQSRQMVRSSANDLALREELLKLPDGFNAARQASVEFAESQRQSQEQLELAYEKTRLSFTTLAGVSLQAGQMLSGLAGKIGGGGFFGSLGGTAGSSFAGSLLKAGSSFIPVVGGLGAIAGSFIGKGLDSLFGHHKKAVDTSADSLNKLATTANKVSEALSNIPQGFKVAYDRFQAATAQAAPSSGGGATGGSSGGSGGLTPDGRNVGSFNLTINEAHFNGVTDVAQFAKQLGEHIEAQFSRGGVTPLTLAFGHL